MSGRYLAKILIVPLVAIVLSEMVYQYVLVPRMAVYPGRLPLVWNLLDFVPLLLFLYLGAVCKTGMELLAASVVAGGLRVVFEFVIAHRNWPGHLKSYAVEAPVYFIIMGLTFFSAGYLALLATGHLAKRGLAGMKRRVPGCGVLCRD